VIDLLQHGTSASSWSHEGNNANAPVSSGGSCGGGGPARVYSFTAPGAGTYNFTTGSLGQRVDTVLYLRSFCQLPAYELGCNDDFITAASRVSVALEEDETIYVFVDSLEGAATGSYKLTVTRL
jgi:hypothetical protein